MSADFVPISRLTRRAFVCGTAVIACAGPSWKMHTVPSDGEFTTLDIKDHPELVTPGGMVAIRPRKSKHPLLVMSLEREQFRILSLRCPHLGCTVRWSDEEQLLRCPCHGSRFDDRGRVLKGPAKKSLQPFPWQRDGTRLKIKIEQA
jgi:Rieske Fe-S protein